MCQASWECSAGIVVLLMRIHLSRAVRGHYRKALTPVARLSLLVLAIALAWAANEFWSTKVAASSAGPLFVEFDSGHVRPLAISPDGTRLFAVNTPNGTLEIFDLTQGSPLFLV
jgi:hypothetical protein